MHDDYNESVGEWSQESVNMTIGEYTKMIENIHAKNPDRFNNIDVPFAIAEFGCATGSSSIQPLIVMIQEIRKI